MAVRDIFSNFRPRIIDYFGLPIGANTSTASKKIDLSGGVSTNVTYYLQTGPASTPKIQFSIDGIGNWLDSTTPGISFPANVLIDAETGVDLNGVLDPSDNPIWQMHINNAPATIESGSKPDGQAGNFRFARLLITRGVAPATASLISIQKTGPVQFIGAGQQFEPADIGG